MYGSYRWADADDRSLPHPTAVRRMAVLRKLVYPRAVRQRLVYPRAVRLCSHWPQQEYPRVP